MADSVSKSSVYLDDHQAVEKLKQLADAADKFAQKMNEARKANDKAGFDKSKREYDAANKELNTYKRTVVDVAKVLNNLNGTSYNNLIKTQRLLQSQTRGMNKDTKEEIALYNSRIAALNKVEAKLKEVKLEMRGVEAAQSNWLGKAANSFNKYFGIITMGIASLTGVIFSFRKVIDTFNEFEKKLSRLSALTGLVGEDMDWLKVQAKEMSTSIIEDGVRITQSADAIVDAFTKVGSARPELLKDKEALREVTQEAIILSEASGDELQPAVEALAMVLNQFNAPASESRRIINALAAGSKEGAGEIPYLTTAFEKAGTVASDAGISIEELIGIIETLAPRISQPEIAGRSLRGVIIDLQKTADDTNPAIVGFSQAIENLGKKNLSTIELIKIFGDENITTAKILLNNTGEMNKYTEAVTGTNVAIEQATINTDNNSSRLEQARNKIKLLSIELGERLAPALTFSTSGFSYLLKATLAIIKFFDQYGKVVVSAVAGITAYNIAVNFSTITTKIYTTATLIAEKATKLFNTTMKSNPIGLVIGLVTSLVTAMAFLATRTREATDEQIKHNEALEEKNRILEGSKSLEERAKLLDQMSKSGLERFKSDAEQQLQEIDKLDEKKLLAATKYQEEVVKLEQWVTTNASNETEKRALYQNQFVTAERDKALAHLQEMTNMVQTANAEQLKSYISLAEEKIKLAGGGGDGSEVNIAGKTKEQWQAEQDQIFIDKTRYIANKVEEQSVAIGLAYQASLEDFEGDIWFPDEETVDDQTMYLMEKYQETVDGRLAIDLALYEAGIISEAEYNDRKAALYAEDAANHKKYNQDKLQAVQIYGNGAMSLTNSISTMYTNAMNRELKAAGDNAKKKEQIQLEYAKKQKNIAYLQAIINTALAVTSAATTTPFMPLGLAMMIVAGIMGGLEVATISSTQFAEGNYADIIGEMDGKRYRAKVANSNHASGLYNEPTYVPGFGLFGETKQPELVFNPADTQKLINSPGLINAINATIGGGRQYASGNTREIIKESRSEMFTDPVLTSLISELRDEIRSGIRANLVANEDYIDTHKKVISEHDSFLNKVNGG